MQTKDFRAAVKAAGEADGLDEGQFTAVVSVFGNEDSVGDVVMPGAFKDDLERWDTKGDPLPVIWSHDWADPFSHIGHVLKAEETETGLQVTGQLDLDNPKAAQVYRLLKGRRVTQFSFAYDVVDAKPRKASGGQELRRLKTYEVGPCLIGANQETELLAVKALDYAAGAKAGRVLSQKNYERLTAAHEALGEVLSAATPQDDDTTKTSEPTGPDLTDEPSQADVPPQVDEEPAGAKSTEATTSAPRRALAVARITNLS